MNNLLILLVGSNPLPSYVVAKYLLNRERSEAVTVPVPDRILFVCSHDTERFMNTIAGQLALDGYDIIILGDDEVRSHAAIREKIESELEGSSQKPEQRYRSVHLNYTGGTKPMAVGAFEAVHSFCCMKNRDIEFISSDLNPWNFKLVHRDGQQFPVTGDLRDSVNLNVRSILELHNISFRSSSTIHTPLFSNWVEKRGLDFHKWRDPNFLKELEESAYGILHNKKLGCVRKWLKSDKNGDKIKKSRSFLDQHGLQFIPLDDENEETWEKASKFLVSGFLEELVFECLNRMRAELRLNDVAYNLVAYNDKREFQIDVIASRGYQLFLFSCTTEHRAGPIKQKSFEVNYRAVQLGGEHAKSVMVCLGSEGTCLDIKKDMSQFDAARNFSIIGSEESVCLEKLENHIRKTIT